jgi:hypothetical protein
MLKSSVVPLPSSMIFPWMEKHFCIGLSTKSCATVSAVDEHHMRAPCMRNRRVMDGFPGILFGYGTRL